MIFNNTKQMKEAPVSDPVLMPMAPQRKQQRISEAAAQAAQHVINLEDENDQLRQQFSVLQNRVALLEAQANDLKRANHELTLERDDYKHHYTHIYNSLQNAGAILVRCMDAPARARDNNGESNARIEEALNNLENEITPAAAPAQPPQG